MPLSVDTLRQVVKRDLADTAATTYFMGAGRCSGPEAPPPRDSAPDAVDASFYTVQVVMRTKSTFKEILGHATVAMAMRYAHLAPEHLRSEVAKTERPTARFAAQRTENLAQEIAQGPVPTGLLSAK